MARHRNRCQVISVYGQRMRSVELHEAFEMVRVRRAAQIKIARTGEPQVIQLLEPMKGFGGGDPRDSDASSASLTFGDMEAIRAGAMFPRARRRGRQELFTDHRGRIACVEGTGNRIDRALSKLEAWPETGDTRAVRVGPRVARASGR